MFFARVSRRRPAAMNQRKTWQEDIKEQGRIHLRTHFSAKILDREEQVFSQHNEEIDDDEINDFFIKEERHAIEISHFQHLSWRKELWAAYFCFFGEIILA